MRANLVSVVSEVDELAHLVGVMRLMRREHGDDRIRAHSVERIRVARDDAFQRVLLHDARLVRLLGLRLAGHRRLRNDDGSACADCQRIQHVLDERNLVLLRVCLRALRIRRIHQADRRALELHLRRILTQEIAAFQIAVAVLAKNHIRSGDSEHVALQLEPVQLLLLDIALLGVRVSQRQHAVHRRNQESGRSACRVEHGVVCLDVHQIAHQVADMARREHDAQRLPVTARIAHELAVEPTDEVLAGLLILDVLEHVLIQELGIELQRGLAQRIVHLVQTETRLQNRELGQQLVLLRIRPDIRTGQTCPDGIHQLIAVTVSGQLVASQGVDVEPAELDFIQCEQDTGHDERLVLVFQRAVCTQILVQLRRILQNLLGRLLDIRRLLENVTRVILRDVLLREPCERLDILQLLVSLAVIHPQRRDDMMLRIAGNTDGEHLLERAVLRDVLRIEVRTVHGIVGHGLHTGVDDSRIGQFNLLVNVGFVFDDKHEITDDSRIFGIPSLAGTAFRRAFQRLVNLFDIASLCIEMNATIIELLGNPQVSLDFLLRHISKLLPYHSCFAMYSSAANRKNALKLKP